MEIPALASGGFARKGQRLARRRGFYVALRTSDGDEGHAAGSRDRVARADRTRIAIRPQTYAPRHAYGHAVHSQGFLRRLHEARQRVRRPSDGHAPDARNHRLRQANRTADYRRPFEESRSRRIRDARSSSHRRDGKELRRAETGVQKLAAKSEARRVYVDRASWNE